MKYLVIFDYDGVIADSLETNLKIAAQVCQTIRHPVLPSRADVERLENIAFDDLGRQIGMPESKIPQFTEIMFDLLSQNMTPPPIFPGIKTVIRKLREKSHLAIVTTNIKRVVCQVLENEGIGQDIDLVMGIEESGSKSEKIGRAMEAFNIPASATYMIGDAVSDVREARKAGVNSIAVTWGYHSRERLLQESPGHVVHAPEEILAILK